VDKKLTFERRGGMKLHLIAKVGAQLAAKRNARNRVPETDDRLVAQLHVLLHLEFVVLNLDEGHCVEGDELTSRVLFFSSEALKGNEREIQRWVEGVARAD
jgi:hypothetical protein